jgi:AraC-like DNA-binding protein
MHNQFHLDYILAHMATLLIVLGISIGIVQFNFSNQFFNYINGFHILSFIFLFLHVESAIKGYKAKFRRIYFVPILAYIIVSILNANGVYLFNYSTTKVFFMTLKIEDPIYYSDKILAKLLLCTPLLIYLIILSLKHINQSITIEKKSVYKFWIYPYALFLLFTMSLSSLYYFNILNTSFDATLNVIIQINAFHSLVIFILNPSIIHYLPTIKKKATLLNPRERDIYTLIVSLFENEQYYLQPNITLDTVALELNFSKKNIQKAIKRSYPTNFNDFVNDYRIKFAVASIHNNYLLKKNIKSLAEDSGFNSHQTFYRAFRRLYNKTPMEYYKSIEVPIKRLIQEP